MKNEKNTSICFPFWLTLRTFYFGKFWRNENFHSEIFTVIFTLGYQWLILCCFCLHSILTALFFSAGSQFLVSAFFDVSIKTGKIYTFIFYYVHLMLTTSWILCQICICQLFYFHFFKTIYICLCLLDVKYILQSHFIFRMFKTTYICSVF